MKYSVVFDANPVNVIVVGEHAVAAIVPGMKNIIIRDSIPTFKNYYDRPNKNVKTEGTLHV